MSMSYKDEQNEPCSVMRTIPVNITNQTPLEFVYLLQEREFVRLNECTYKVGKTTQPRLKRFDQYPNGSEVLFFRCVENSSRIESLMIEELKKSFTFMKCYGSEYFNGNKNHMIKMINKIIDKEESTDIEPVKNEVPLFSSLFEECVKKYVRITNSKDDFMTSESIYRKVNDEMTMSITKFGKEMMKLLPAGWSDEEKRKKKKVGGKSTWCYFGIEEIDYDK